MLKRSVNGIAIRVGGSMAFAATWIASTTCSRSAEAPVAKESYQFDFRQGRFDNDVFVPAGYDSPYSMQFIKPEPKGLRILIPDTQGRTRPKMGMFTALKLEGDFEITAAFELVKAEAPDVRAGVGANVYIMAEKSLNGATLRRCVAPNGEERFFIHWSLRQADGTRGREADYAPATTREGRMRFARTGATLSYLIAEANDTDFSEIKRVEFGTEPIGLVEFQAVTDGASKNVDMIWRTVSIRADRLRHIDIPLLRRPAVK